jgi:twitching motility protein PilT
VKLVDSLLDTISRLEGDALIIHVGEKPYVVTSSASMYAYRGPVAWGHVELSSRVLTTDAVAGMLEQLLPDDQRTALAEYGAIEYELPPGIRSSADRFTVVAARGGDDVWLEIRRTPSPMGDAAQEAAPAVAVEAGTGAEADAHGEAEPVVVAESASAPEPVVVAAPEPAPEPEPAVAAEAEPEPEAASAPIELETAEPAAFEIVEEEEQIAPTQAEVDALLNASAAALVTAPDVEGTGGITFVESVEPESEAEEPEFELEIALPPPVAQTFEPLRADVAQGFSRAPRFEPPPTSEQVEPESESEPVTPGFASETPDETRQAVILSLTRPAIPVEPPVEVRRASGTPLERVLRIAAARGAATVYVVAQSQPVIRVDGEISVLDGEPALTAADVERLVMDLAPARARDAAPAGEWMADVPDVGRVRCVTFRDHRGPGVIFRMIPPKAISADQLGISAEVQALCAQPDGLVLVTGARASGKSTLLSAFVDLINRTRSDHVITIESQIGFVHESRRSFVSQREVRGDSEAAAGAVRSAFREDPDVLVIEDIRTPEIVSAALQAAASGRLVFGSVAAPSTVAALDRLIEMFPAERRAQAQTSLAGALRGVVAQTLLRKVRGGQIAAREVLLNTPAVASLIIEGKTFQLPVAIDSGRRHGMMPLADALAALVRDGTVHAAEAYRKAPDPGSLIAALKRDGVDTSFAERLA